jgi:hypothetical protein
MNLNVRFSDEPEPVRRLAAIAGAPPPSGPVMLAELDDEPVAAIGIADGRSIADPCRSNPAIVALLKLRRLEVRTLVAIFGI